MNNKQTFQYLMDFYRLDRVPIFYGNSFVGYVSRDLSYSHSNALSYMRREEDAIELAYKQINDIVSLIKELKEEAQVKVVHFWETWGEGWNKIKKTETKEWSGTLDDIFEKFEKENNRLRYCNGDGFKFEDANVALKYRLWSRLIPEWRSFHLYYGSGTVD